MDIESQKHMALEGTKTWALGTIRFASECDKFISSLMVSDKRYLLRQLRADFEVSRHCFLIAAFKLLEHAQWAATVGVLSSTEIEELETYAAPIKLMRDLNEHKLEYFQGRGRNRPLWISEVNDSSADASSTVHTRIGNILDWREVAQVASRLNARIPDPNYLPFSND